jgi:hypothetical protein
LIIQFPPGKLFNTALPVATVQEGCVMVPIVGTTGTAFTTITAFPLIPVIHDVAVIAASTV